MGGTHDDRMRHRHDGALLPSARREALIQGRQVGPLGAGRRMGQLCQARAQGSVAFASLPRAPLPGTLVIARCHPAPGRQLVRGLKAPHVEAPFRHQQLPPALIHPGNGVQDGHGAGKRHRGWGRAGVGSAPRCAGRLHRRCGGITGPEVGQATRNLNAQGVDLFVQEVDVRQLQRQQLSVMGGVPTMLFSENSSGSLPAPTHQWPKRRYHAE